MTDDEIAKFKLISLGLAVLNNSIFFWSKSMFMPLHPLLNNKYVLLLEIGCWDPTSR